MSLKNILGLIAVATFSVSAFASEQFLRPGESRAFSVGAESITVTCQASDLPRCQLKSGNIFCSRDDLPPKKDGYMLYNVIAANNTLERCLTLDESLTLVKKLREASICN